MSKRAASYDIDEHTFEAKEKNGDHQPIDPQGQHMNGRKIFKIARKTEHPHNQSNEKVDLKIQGLDKLAKNDKTKEVSLPPNPIQFDMFKQSQGVGLFSNIFSNSNSKPTAPSTQPQPNKQAASEVPKTEVIPSKPLFGSNPSQGKGSIFGNSFGTGGSIFSNTSNSILFNGSSNSFSTGNLFGNAKISGPLTAPPEDDEGDSQQLQKDQQMEVDPTKTAVTYNYDSDIAIIQKIQVKKYKKDKGDLIEDVEALISHHSTKKLHYLVVRLPATKKVIFTGLILPHKSKITTNGDNIDLLIFSIVNDGLEPNRIKLQIKSQNNEKDQFICNLNKIITGKQESK